MLYISNDNSKNFLNQRLKVLEKIFNKKKIKYSLFLFSDFDLGIQKISNIIKNKFIKKIYVLRVYHIAGILNKEKINQFFQNYILKIKIKIKIILMSKFSIRSLLTKIDIINICFTNKSKNYLKKYNFPKNIYFAKPSLNFISQKKIDFLYLKKKKFANSDFFFDSHFPFHPDSFVFVNKYIFFKLFDIYIKYLKRILFDKKTNYNIFLNPRTFDNIKKNKAIIEYIKKNSPEEFTYYSGVFSFFKMKNKNLKKITVQPGSQLSFIKHILKNNKINFILKKLDNKFVDEFFLLKKRFKNNNIINNYEIIEINAFKELNSELFINLS
jgi:hypothetical protein